MRMAFLVMAHKNPSQIARLLSALDYPGWDVYLHIDAKVDIAAFREALGPGDSRTFVVPARVAVQWGGFSQVWATLNAMREAVASAREYGYIHLLSGQDYPIKEVSDIDRYFAEHRGEEFIGCAPLPRPDFYRGGLDRVTRYHFLDFWGRRYRRVDRFLAFLLPRRSFPHGYQPFAGSQWWSLTLECVRFILAKVEEEPELARYFKHVYCPDEHFFQTLLMQSRYATRVAKVNPRYCDWTDPLNYPKIFGRNDLAQLEQAQGFFARKFDTEYDSEILDLLDAKILKRNPKSFS